MIYPSWDGAANVTRNYSYGYDSSDGSLSSMLTPLAIFTLNYDGLKRLSSISI